MRGEPYAGEVVAAWEMAEVADAVAAARDRRDRAAALSSLCDYVISGKHGNPARIPIGSGDVLDMIASVDAATPGIACRTILAIARRTGVPA